MTDRDDDVSLEELLERFRNAVQEDLHTALPGRVESYDRATQTANVRPMVRRALPNVEGGTTAEEMPVLRAVPVVWPRVGNWFLHMPLAVGDSVLLVVLERDLARWRQTGELGDPIDHRAHHLSHAVAIPGLFHRAEELAAGETSTADARANELILGHVTGQVVRVSETAVFAGRAAEDPVAMSSPTAARLDAIEAALDALSNASPTIGDGGAALQTAFKTVWDIQTAPGTNIASSNLNAEDPS